MPTNINPSAPQWPSPMRMLHRTRKWIASFEEKRRLWQSPRMIVALRRQQDTFVAPHNAPTHAASTLNAAISSYRRGLSSSWNASRLITCRLLRRPPHPVCIPGKVLAMSDRHPRSLAADHSQLDISDMYQRQTLAQRTPAQTRRPPQVDPAPVFLPR
jgi:hypothetical protein